VLSDRTSELLESVPEERLAQAQALISDLQTGITDPKAVDAKDKEQIIQGRAKLLNLVSQLEDCMVQGFPHEVPPEYSNLPQLKGRATVEVTTNKAPSPSLWTAIAPQSPPGTLWIWFSEASITD